MPGVNSLLIAGIVRFSTMTGDCSNSKNTAVPYCLEIALATVGTYVADWQGTVSEERLKKSAFFLNSNLTKKNTDVLC